MVKAIMVFILAILLSGTAIAACNSDFDCGYGNKCVKAKGNFNVTGICVTPSDRFGNKTYKYSAPSSRPQTVRSCSFDTDCGIGFSCMKRSGQIYGICLK
jgi:hypothetical protein